MSVVLVEAKKEYTEQIVGFLRPAIFDDFFVMWRTAVEKNTKEPMVGFQELLETIVDWDEKTILRKTDAIVKKSGCSFLDDLITAVFVAHMKVMLTVKNQNQKDKYRLQVPTANRFIHQTMIQCAREFWKAPYLFYQNETENKIKKTQIQMNLRTAEEIISDAIRTTIRKMLPVKEIVGDVLEYDENGGLIVDIEKRVEIPDASKEDDIDDAIGASKVDSPTSQPLSGKSSLSSVSSQPPLAQQLTAPATPVMSGETTDNDVDKELHQNIVQQLRRFEAPVIVSMTDTTNQTGGVIEGTGAGADVNGEDDDSEYEGDGFIMGPIDDEIEIVSDDTKTTPDKDEILGGIVEEL
jgi:hypothetical protein